VGSLKLKVKSIYCFCMILISATLFLAGCSSQVVVKPFVIIGDVENVVQYDNFDALNSLMVNGSKHKVISIMEVLETAEPKGLRRITFIGVDDHSATIDVSDLEGSYLGWDSEHDWYFVSDRYPVNTHIKNIRQIIVQGENAPGMEVIDESRNYSTINPGDILSASHRLYIHEEGSTAREFEEVVYKGSSISRHVLRQINELVPGTVETVKAVGQDGSMHMLSLDSYIEASGNSIYLNRFDHTPRIELAGLVLDPPARMVTDLYDDVLELVDQDKQVLVLMLDGFSYLLYERALEELLAPSILDGAYVDKALSVFPPITPCGLAAMLTGKLPDENGIGSRDDRIPKVPSLLETLEDRGKKGVVITGGVFPIQLKGEVILNPDLNGNGSCDDETFKKAIEYMNSDYDLIFIHFKDVDRSGHAFGPLADETSQSLLELDSYVGQLYGIWSGSRIVITDHGMHQTEEGGLHGLFKYEDMFIPYITYE
jgi:hypothetical protein